jgi:hypothetical protein
MIVLTFQAEPLFRLTKSSGTSIVYALMNSLINRFPRFPQNPPTIIIGGRMKFQSRSQIEVLTKFDGQGDLVTSFFLDTDKGRLNRKEIQIALKHLLNGARAQVDALDASRERIQSLECDLALIGDHGAKMLAAGSGDGLAVFSCSRRNFWQALELPHGPRNRVMIDVNFYVRPLAAILDKYSSICALLLSRREARWYDISMGEIKALDEIKSDVPGRVRDGGFEGTEGKKIERHLDALQENGPEDIRTQQEASLRMAFHQL